jgi:hypothetical protein
VSSGLRLARALMLLGLLAGLFAMHGLAANHDTSALVLQHKGRSHVESLAAGMAHVDSSVTASSTEGGAERHGHAAAETCLAVLVGLGALALALGMARARARFLRDVTVRTAGGWLAAAARGRRFSLSLVELSLSRT